MQLAAVAVAGLRAPGLDRLGDLFAVRTEIADQRLEERPPPGGIEIVIAIEHLARHRGAGGLAPAGQQRLAQFDQVGGILLGVGGDPPRRSRVRPRSEMVASRSEKKALAMWSSRIPGGDPTWIYGRPTIKRIWNRSRRHAATACRGNQASARPHRFSTNSVGVLPVTCRKACENAGTLA